MSDLKLISNYHNIDKYRLSFNKLAISTFRADFEQWYQKGFWNDKYICYSYIDNDEVISNVSISKMDIVWEGKNKKALQLGAVMTHPAYRNRGLSADLMRIILEENEKNYDFIYLFANKSVLDFYPKFGFKQLEETQFSMYANFNKSSSENIRKLDMNDTEDLNILTRLASERTPISKILGVKNDEHLVLFYCVYVFGNDIYYLEDEDTIIIFKNKEDVLHIYDILSCHEIHIENILNRIGSKNIGKVIFHFTPDFKEIEVVNEPFMPIDTLFIKPASIEITEKFIFPMTSHG